MLIEPIELLPTVYGILMISKKLDDDFLRYKNCSEYLMKLVEYINKVYDLSQYDIKESIPKPISKLCEYTYEFKVVVEKLEKMNFIKRLFRLNYYNEKMNQKRTFKAKPLNVFDTSPMIQSPIAISDSDLEDNSRNWKRRSKKNKESIKKHSSISFLTSDEEEDSLL